ncbi:MAG: transposase [Candidatus Thiodiazotropha sp. (ex Lucinoma aequizonata)]|nr:transposase [Candidatus Thiodiazotropha sp. (ex Lucinoma aequizonata)]
MNATLESLPGAEEKIAFDKFHVAKYLGEGVDKVRRQEHKVLMSEGYEDLKWSKYDWLYNLNNMTHKQKLRFKSLRESTSEDGQSMGDQRVAHVTLALCQQNVGSERLGSVVIMGHA